MRVVLAIAAVLAAIATTHAEVRRIRLCADPSNLPFSARHETHPGFEVEVARAIAGTLGASLDVHWVPTAREMVALRRLYEGRCDLFMGLPLTPAFRDDKPRLTFAGPYYLLRQGIVSPTSGGVRDLDALGGKVVGVQAMTLGDHLVFQRGEQRKVYRDAEELFTALVRSEIDAAVIDSPLAGWFVTKTAGFRVVELSDPARDVPIGAAVRKADVALKEQIDGAIQRLQGTTLPMILARYGLAQASTPAAAEAPLSAELRTARSTYLTQCSQCHGVDAKGTPVAANLQAFKGSEADFVRIVREGRPGTAMTPWKGLISDDDIRAIGRYVKQLSAGAGR